MGSSSCASYYQLTSFSCLGNVKAKMPNKNVKFHDSLIKEDIIGEIEHRGVFVKHDLYSDWALDYMLLSELIDTASIESKLVSKPTISMPMLFVDGLQRR